MDKKADLYVVFHRPVDYGIWDDELWTPLQVGSYGKERLLEQGYTDCEGDNISEWNRLFWENTGLYWIWKNGLTGKKYAGMCQYRRRLDFHTEEELDRLFTDYDVIAASPIFLFGNIKDQYCDCHNSFDMNLCEKIVKTLYPDYREDWDKYISKGRFLFYSNGFILREDDFKKYCEWLFSIFRKYIEEMRWCLIDDVVEYVKKQIDKGMRPNSNGHGGTEGALTYQCAIFGFLSERLWTLWMLHNYDPKRIFTTPYLKMENV